MLSVALGLVLWSPVAASASALALGPVRSVKATKLTSSSVSLSWVNPAASSFAGAVVREAKGTTPPKSPTSGKLVGTVKKPGRTITAKGLTASTTYSFSVFAFSKGPHYAKGAGVTATTSPKPGAPVITSVGSATFSVGKSGTFTVKATGSPAPAMSESGALPSGVSFRSSTHVLSGTPAAGTGGTYPVTFTASNGVGSPATQHFTLSVDQAPAITSGDATTFRVGVNGSFAVRATGFPAPAISESGALPSGVSFSSATGILSGKPAAAATGTYALTFTASNGVGTAATQHFTLTINEAPAITSADGATFSVGKSGSFTVKAAGDPAPAISESGALPSGVSFSSSTDVLSGTPAGGTGGTYPVTFTASNGVGSPVVQHFTLSVDQAPAITSGDAATFSVGVSGTFAVQATGYPVPSVTESGALASGLSFDSETGVLSGRPAAGTTGTYSLTFTASNGVGTAATQDFTLTVGAAPACTDSWTGADSSDWDDPGNWSSSQVPGASDWACIPAGGSNEPVLVSGGEVQNISGLTDSGSLEVDGSLTFWGTKQSSVAGTLTIFGSITLADALEVTGTLDLESGSVSGPGTVTIGNGATWTVEGGQVQDAAVINEGTATVKASDTLALTAGATLLNDADLRLLGDSAVNGDQDVCAASPGLTNSGTLTVAATSTGTDSLGQCLTVANSGAVDLVSGTLDLSGGTLDLDSGTSFSGSGTLEFEGTLSVNTTLSIPSLEDDGTLTGSSPLTVTGSLDSDGGSFDGPGTVTVGNGAAWSVESTTINGGTVVNNGSAELGANDDLTIEPGAELSNTASLTMDADSAIEGNQDICLVSAEFVNSGTVTVAATRTGTDSLGQCVTVANSGPVDLSSGTLDVSSGTLDLDSGTSFSGSGTLEFEGTLSVNTTLSIASVQAEGTLTGSSPLTVTGSLDSAGGSFNGPGTVTVGSGAAWSIESTSINGGTVVNDGTAALSANADLDIEPGAQLSNTASLTMDADSSIDGDQDVCPATPELVNTGTLTAAATKTGTDSLSDCLTVADSGVVDLSSGTLDLASGRLDLDSGNSFSGSGTLEAGGTIAVNAGSSVSVLELDGGTVQGTGGLTVTSALTEGDGTFAGPGTVTIGSGATWEISSTSVTGGEVVSDGSATLDDNAGLGMDERASVVNDGAMTFGENSSVYADCNDQNATAALDNSGTFAIAPGSGNTVTFSGNGSGNCLTVDSTSALGLSSGTLAIQGGSLLKLGSGTSVSGSGALEDSSGTIMPLVSVTIPTLDLAGGIFEIPAAVTATASSLPSPSGTIQLDGTANFGRLATGGAAAVGSLSVSFSDSSYSPVCGATVTVATAATISGAFSNISGGTLPSGASWDANSTAKAAQAVVSCPIPAISESQTYGTGSWYDGANPSGYFAEPVDTATGAYSTTETDAKLASAGIAFAFTRSYTSSNAYSGPLGTGWTDSMNVFLAISGSTVTVSDENGQQVGFTANGDGTYTPAQAGVFSTLTQQQDGDYLLVRQDQTHLLFNSTGQLISETNRNGIGLTLSYNGNGELASVATYAGQTVSFSYNPSGQLTQLTFPPSRTVSYTYNANGDLASVTDAGGGTTTYGYNSSGLLATVTDQDGNQIVDNTYNSGGQVISQVNALNQTATFSYDAADSTSTYTDPDGGQWTDTYDGYVLVSRTDPAGGTTDYSYDSNLDVTAITDPDGNTTTMSYNAAGDMLTKTQPYPLNATESYSYDSMNDVTSSSDYDGNTTTYSYNADGDLVGETLPDSSTLSWTVNAATGLPTSFTDARGNTTSDGYNSGGELTSVTDPQGNQTTYAYDPAGRKVSMTSPRGNAAGADAADFTTTYAYNAEDDVTSQTNPDGDVTSYGYDADGNKTSVTDPDGNTTSYGYNGRSELTSVTAPGGAKTSYAYDGNGDRTSITDADNNTTQYGYDKDGNLTSVTNALGKVTSYTYDADGNLLTKQDADGNTTTYGYDALSRLTSVSYSDSTPAVSYSYDADGNRVQLTDGTGKTAYSYNSRGELTSLSSPEGTWAYGYDADGDVTSRTYPDGTVVSYTYDKDERLATVVADGKTTSYGYDPDGDLTSIAMPNGVTETRTYDDADRLASVSDSGGSGVITSFTYTDDDDGNPTKVVTPSQTDTYAYNARDFLTQACYGPSCADGQISYSYDADGNRTQMADNSATTNYSYNVGDQLTSATTGAATTDYTYNADGERTSAGSSTYTWNAAGEITGSDVSGTTTKYGYDGDGTRVSATTSGATTTYAFDLNNPVPQLAQVSQSGSETDRFVYADGLLLSMRTGGADYYVSHDALGSTVALTSASGATDTTFTYDPYGNVRIQDKVVGSAPAIPLLFEGQLMDPDGLYQLQARDMDPTTGSFVSVDPLAQPATTPQLSPYLYAGDQPTVLEDPSGEFSWDVIKQGATAFAEGLAGYAGDAAGHAVSAISDVVTGVQDVASIATCGAWYSVACEVAYQKAGVDLAVGLVSTLCVGTVLLVAACSAVVAAGGQWVLDTFGVKVPGQTPGDTNEPAK